MERPAEALRLAKAGLTATITEAIVMASNSLSRFPITFEMRVRHAIMWQAQQAARAEVVRKLKAAGVKTALMSGRAITRLALDYLREHQAELLAQAKASGAVQRLRAEGDFANIKK